MPLLDLLPEDGSVQGFDNVADGLSISSVLMESYLQAADVAFDATIRRIKPLPPETRRIEMMEVKENIEPRLLTQSREPARMAFRTAENVPFQADLDGPSGEKQAR